MRPGGLDRDEKRIPVAHLQRKFEPTPGFAPMGWPRLAPDEPWALELLFRQTSLSLPYGRLMKYDLGTKENRANNQLLTDNSVIWEVATEMSLLRVMIVFKGRSRTIDAIRSRGSRALS
jgi:hypothetical protein